MPDELSVRQWQEQFRAGAFNLQDRYTQCRAGWYDWFCQDHALAGRLKKIGRVVMGITDPFILDNYYVWFKNNCPLNGPLYDDVRFEPLSGNRDGKYFVISLDSPHERMKWALVTERYGFDAPEFDCRDIREMIRYVNSIGPELQKGSLPPFIAEKKHCEVYHDGFTQKKTPLLGDVDVLPQSIRLARPNRLAARVKAGVCELCGKDHVTVHMHHVRSLKNLKGTTPCELKMLAMRRRSIALCPDCFAIQHNTK